MITREQYAAAKVDALDLIEDCGVLLRPEELDRIEVLDFGLGEIEQTGLQVVPVLETDALAVRLVALLPGQTCPEHLHSRVGEYRGKEETFRCQWGELYVHLPGPPTPDAKASPPAHRAHTYTSPREMVLHPGEQVTSLPGERHWFQAGPQGAVAWLFCTRCTDAEDEFTDPAVRRMDPAVGGG